MVDNFVCVVFWQFLFYGKRHVITKISWKNSAIIGKKVISRAFSAPKIEQSLIFFGENHYFFSLLLMHVV